MSITFDPQFHRKIRQANDHVVWQAIQHPKSVIPVKSTYYQKWQAEECARLQEAGEVVVQRV